MTGDFETEQRILGTRWPDLATRHLWRKHGGDWHGPRVETVTMPMHLLPGFLDAFVTATLADRDRELEEARRRVAELKGERDEAHSTLAAIHDFAHDRSTGPAVPDALWEIRSMASTLITGGIHGQR